MLIRAYVRDGGRGSGRAAAVLSTRWQHKDLAPALKQLHIALLYTFRSREARPRGPHLTGAQSQRMEKNANDTGAAAMRVLGIDIGGSGIKGAPVDTRRGKLVAERHRIPTPQPATPGAVAGAVAQLVRHFDWKGPIGCAVPAVVQQGFVRTASNISKGWLGIHAPKLFRKAVRLPVTVINDADAAGYAEMHFGGGRRHAGLVIIVTLGTGIGTALFVNGHLVPNTELGHIEIHGRDAEKWAAASVRATKNLSWKKWAHRIDVYLRHMQRYFWPDLFIIGGGVSRKHAKFLPRLTVAAQVVPARLGNDAGIIGAALAYEHERRRAKQKRSLG